MGVDISQWRARIGCFSQPAKTVVHMQVLRIGNVSFAIRALLLLLLVVQGVESNPGPGDRRRGSRGDGKGRYRRADEFSSQDTQNTRVTRRSTRNANGGANGGAAQASMSSSDPLFQQQLITWFTNINEPQEPIQGSNLDPNNQSLPNSTQSENEESRGAEQTQSNENDETDSDIDIDPEEADIDIDSEINLKTILLDIRKDVKQINHKFDTMKKSIKDLKKSNKLLQRQNDNLTKTVSELKGQVDDMELAIQQNTDANERIEAQ